MSILFFTHIPKTAGSSFTKSLLVPNYGQGYLRPSGLKGLASMQVPSHACVHGHFPFGMHWCKPWRKVSYISFLRDPVSRVISHYYFVRQSPWHPMYDRHMQTPLEKIFEEEGGLPISALRSNLQTRFLAGYRLGFWQTTDDATLLKAAKRNVEKHYRFIGLQERYAESCEQLASLYGWDKVAEVLREQKTNKKPTIPDKVVQVIRDHNQLDQELYDFVKKRFFDANR
jgi:hypothetical protein